jgi:hypothetical protein
LLIKRAAKTGETGPPERKRGQVRILQPPAVCCQGLCFAQASTPGLARTQSTRENMPGREGRARNENRFRLSALDDPQGHPIRRSATEHARVYPHQFAEGGRQEQVRGERTMCEVVRCLICSQ